MARKPRIITETVRNLRELADDADAATIAPDMIAKKLRTIADKLNEYDARETRKDPSKRRKAKKTARR